MISFLHNLIKNPMFKLYLILVVIMLFHLVGYSQYRLIWSDEFNSSTLDSLSWTVEQNADGGGNQELQYYSKNNVFLGTEPVSGKKCLVLEARKEKSHGREFTSGRLNSAGKREFKYGKIEALIRLPHTSNGLWPAFWMLGADISKVGWPASGEIDILEMGNADGIAKGIQDSYFNGACHWGKYKDNGTYPNKAIFNTSAFSLQDGFHLYTLIWDSKSIRMYLDFDAEKENKPYFEMKTEGENKHEHPSGYFNKPFFILFNLAIGGKYTNLFEPDQISAIKDRPVRMYVDYVKVYENYE